MKYKKIIIFVVIAFLIVILVKSSNINTILSENNLIEWFNEIISSNYAIAAILYMVFTALACVLLALPGITFAAIAGILFGPWVGSLLCLIGTTIGAMLSFIVGRYFLKDTLKPTILKNKALKALLFTNKPGNELILLMITRLLPVFPFNLQNFAYGITDISIIKYSLATFVFMIPGVVLFTFMAAGIIDNTQRVRFFTIAVIFASLLGIISVCVKRIYRKQYPEQGELDER